MKNINSLLFDGAVWMVFMRFFIKGMGFISTLILARLLTPEDFGVVAIVMAIYALIDMMKQFGFEMAIIQKQDASEDDYNTAWTIKVIFGLLAASILFFSAGAIANYYDDARIEAVCQVVALLFVLNSTANIGVVDFIKDLKFKIEFKFRIWVKLLAVVVTISCAFMIGNYWALVIGMLMSALIENIMSYVWSSYRPRFSLAKVRALFSFSIWLLLNSLLQYMYNQFSGLVVGRLVGTGGVGVFKLMTEFANLPSGMLIASVSRAAYPAYTKVAQQPSVLTGLYFNVLKGTSIIGVAFGLILSVSAPYFVPLVLGEQWSSGIPVMQVLGISQAFMCINGNTSNLFMAMGQPRLSTVILSIRVSALLTFMFFLGRQYGLVGFAYSYLFTSILTLPLTFYFVRRLLNVSLWQYLQVLSKPLLAGVLCFFLSHAFILQLPQLSWLTYYKFIELLAVIAFVGTTYLLVYYVMWLFTRDKTASFEYKVFKSILKKLGFGRISAVP